jgi:hypothetical protein
MIYLFVGLASSGILARLTLLAHRGEFFLADESNKPMARVVFELVGMIVGIAGFAVAFLIFDWWIPLLAFVIGYWVIPVFTVNLSTFPLLYNLSFLFTLVSAACSILLIMIFVNS